MAEQQFPIGRRIDLPGHFAEPVVLESVRALGDGFECRVRLSDGTPDEAILSRDEAATIFGRQAEAPTSIKPVDAESLRLLVESSRIRLAYTHDRHFAVSLSGIRTLPHQIEAVYLRMLPQPRLRYLLADDPGAGKTIMAGLLIKEMRLREAIDRVLILCPAPLTIQWQDELLRWFGESFDIIFSAVDQQQLINPWHRTSQVIASLDYAKQDDVRERVLSERWDLVIIDEAHKCSAYTKSSSGRGDEIDKTKRYQLAERLASNSDHLLLLTATPHHGDDDRFAHFIRLIDSDLFPEPHRVGNKATEIRRDILKLGPDCPWALRRLKEDLRDLRGRRLFPDRHAHTVAFKLTMQEYDLYKAVTAYINQFLPQSSGRKQASVALARTVFQRRLASSTMAIYESIRRRLERQQDLLKELEDLSPAQRARRLAQLQGRLADVEQDEDDLDDAERDQLVDQFTASVGLEQLQAEVAALQDLIAQARRVRDHGSDSKLAALKACLERAEFKELSGGRGKLLIFTEHRDTLNYLCERLAQWGYTTCQIHGGMNPHERKRAQEQFRTEKQICVATEAAGEGINLQFCRLMINYDLPWNPTRLEQRLGRIHRIGQERDVHAFNFVASASEEGQPIVEGRILERLLEKLEQMRAVLADRVFDVIGEVLSINDVNLPDILREAAFDPRRLDDYLDQIARIDPNKLKQYEEATGIALARANVDFSGFQQANAEAEERRLMPRYVEEHFVKASAAVGLKVEPRADGLWRIEHVLADLRSDRLQAVRKLGKPDTTYRKATFRKEHLDQDQHLDAVLVGPGHPLYAVVDEKLNELLTPLVAGVGVFLDDETDVPYRLHLFEVSIRGQTSKGEQQTLHGELVAVREEMSGPTTGASRFSMAPADCLLDLPPHPEPPAALAVFDPSAAADHVKVTFQMQLRSRCQEERRHFVDICRDYLNRSFEARIRASQDRVMALRMRESSQPEVALARQRAENELTDIERTRRERLAGLDRLTLVKHGPVRHVATALVLPAGSGAGYGGAPEDIDPNIRRRSELAAEDLVVAHETGRGWECERVGHLKIGFDVRSIGPADTQTGYRDPVEGIRRIEVKGRTRGFPIRLTTNEWYKAAQLGDSYWLYVVWDPLGAPDPLPLIIRNPVKHLDHAKREVIAARHYDIPAQAIEAAALATKEGELMNDQDKRLIEDYLPIVAISEEASREKNVRKGHISTLHLWWARRPLVACRAAVYGALVPASRFVPNGASDDKKKSLGRANAAKFVERLCKYPGDSKVIAEAQRHILEAHAERLTKETGKPVTVEDIEAGRAPRPKVLDMFAGGGAIPLEALRLGCEAYALDLNPVAHIIQLCTLVYPQKYGKPDPTARGMTGPTNAKNETTWGGLAKEVRYWAEWVLRKVKAEIGDLYPLIPDPAFKGKRDPVKDIFGVDEEVSPGYLVPVAYLWTRTVTCKNPTCKATVPLVKQTWLCKKKDQYVALKMIAPKSAKQVRFQVVETKTEKALGFDPAGFSKAGNTTCPFCAAPVTSEYVKDEGTAIPSRMDIQPMAVVCIRPGARGKVYLATDDLPPEMLPNDTDCLRRIGELSTRTGVTVPDEPIINDAKGSCWIRLYGFLKFGDLFMPRQILSLLSLSAAVRDAHREMMTGLHSDEASKCEALACLLACIVDKQADFNSSLARLKPDGGRGIVNTFGRQGLPMVWDFAEANPFNKEIASWSSATAEVVSNIATLSDGYPGYVQRGSAMAQPWPDGSLDAVITDPPYYDNVPYSNISDFFYVWLKRSVGDLHPEHLSGVGTPKKQEAVADATRHGGDRPKANRAYEQMMAESLAEAHRVLKPGGALAVVYAHKTTLGWATLVDAFRRAGFTVTEAWPLDTETSGRLRAQESAALASSIFLVGRKREGKATGSYETDVQPELESIVRERVETLWDQGISGADLVIACVGAGLRAFTRFARVEYANGDEVPAERFLLEVETVVLDSILARLSKEVGGKGTSLAGVDPATRFYTLWRYTYRAAELDAGEAIIFANGTHVELDGPSGLSSRADALVEKKKGKFRLRDFTERGDDDKLGQPTDAGLAAPLVDVLHRVLWLMEHRPRELPTFLREAEPNREQLRLVAQALAGPALKGGEMTDVSPTGEMAALAKLTSNWRSVIEDNATTAAERADVKRGQNKLFE